MGEEVQARCVRGGIQGSGQTSTIRGREDASSNGATDFIGEFEVGAASLLVVEVVGPSRKVARIKGGLGLPALFLGGEEPMKEAGYRVGAICDADDYTVRLYGYGVYDGDFQPPVDFGGRTNPRITLDSGKVVWGYECWWGPEDQVKKNIGGREVVVVDIDEIRAGV